MSLGSSSEPTGPSSTSWPCASETSLDRKGSNGSETIGRDHASLPPAVVAPARRPPTAAEEGIRGRGYGGPPPIVPCRGKRRLRGGDEVAPSLPARLDPAPGTYTHGIRRLFRRVDPTGSMEPRVQPGHVSRCKVYLCSERPFRGMQTQGRRPKGRDGFVFYRPARGARRIRCRR